VTEQRERVTTDPGIGPVDPNNASTLLSIESAEEVEPDGVSLYYEPQDLVPALERRSLELETVRLSAEIDPRKQPTELSLRSPAPPQYDSGWPQAEVALTTSQRPEAPRRSRRVPLVLLSVLVALLLLVLGRAAVRRLTPQGSTASASQRVEALPLATPKPALPVPVEQRPAPAIASAPASTPIASAVSTPIPASSAVTAHTSSAVTGHPANLARHGTLKANLSPSASSRPLSEPAPSKPKRAIY